MSEERSDASIFVARQPIWDDQWRVVGYELLYRSGLENRNTAIDGDTATTEVLINSVLGIGLERLVGHQTAYFNVTASFLRGDRALPLDRDEAVLEILEDVEIDDGLLRGVRNLREDGFTIALDDFEYQDSLSPLLDLADIVKIDVMGRDRSQLKRHLDLLAGYDITLLAEKVETHEEFEACKALGFAYFQGFFFSKPHIMQGGGRVANNRLVILNLIAQLQDPEVELPELEKLLIQDVALTYRLLRYVNSPAFGITREVETISRALTLIGADRIRNWATLLLMTRIEDKPLELMRTALVRARLGRSIAGEIGAHGELEQAFTCGLLSVVDALMDCPMGELLEDLPVSDAVRAALNSRHGRLGGILSAAIAYEQGLWDQLPLADVSGVKMADFYVESLAWADGVMNSLD